MTTAIGALTSAAAVQRASLAKVGNDGDADDRGATKTQAATAPKVNDGDADDSTATTLTRLSSNAQSAMLKLIAGD